MILHNFEIQKCDVNYICICCGIVKIGRVIRVHSVLEKSLKMLEFGIKTSGPLKVLENR